MNKRQKRKKNEETTDSKHGWLLFDCKRAYKTKRIPRVLMFLPVFEANFSNAASLKNKKEKKRNKKEKKNRSETVVDSVAIVLKKE